MKFKGTFWMLAVLIAIAAYYFLVDLPTEQKKKEEQERSETALLFEVHNLEEFSVKKKNDFLRLKRTGPDSWELVEPVQARADNLAFLDFLADLQILKIDRVVEESPADLSVYGLKDPSMVFTLKLKDKTEKTFSLGDDHPLGHNIFALRGGENKVLLISAFRDTLGKTVYDLRDKTLLDFKASEVKKITLEREDETIKLQRKEKEWSLADNAHFQVDADEVQKFLNSVLREGVKEFIEEMPESLAGFGLDSPSIRLNVELETDEEKRTLLIGSKKEDSGYHAKTGAPIVVLVDKKLVETLSQRSVTFLDRHLLAFEEKDVTGIGIRTPEENLKIAREEKENWKITSPAAFPGDTATINSLLFDLKEGRIQEYVKTTITEAALFGLDNPKRTFTLEREGHSTWTLSLGNHTSDGKHFFAGRSTDSAVFVVTEETVIKLFRTLHDLKNKKLLSFRTDDINRILIEYPDQVFELEKNEKQWNLLKPESIRNIQAFLGTDILWTLNNLEYEALVQPLLEDSASGIADPVLKVSIWDKEGKQAGQLIVGKKPQDAAQYYARVGGETELYRIGPRFLDEIPSDLSKFKSE